MFFEKKSLLFFVKKEKKTTFALAFTTEGFVLEA